MAVDILVVATIIAAVVGILALFVSIFFAIRQIRVATTGLQVATTALSEDRKERTAQREQRRAALLTALRAEVETIRSAADADLNDYEGTNLSHPRIAQKGSDREVEGRERYRVSFPWTSLPDTAIQEAIREAGLLGLTAVRIQKLLELRARILRINSLVLHKANLYPPLMLAPVPRNEPLIYGDRPWAFDKAVVLNNDIWMTAKYILADCAEMTKWWEGEGAGMGGPRPGRPGGPAAGTQRAGRWRIVAAARKWISSRLSRLIRRGGA